MRSLNRGVNSTSGSLTGRLPNPKSTSPARTMPATVMLTASRKWMAMPGFPARNAAMMPGSTVAESVGSAATATKPLALADSACVLSSAESRSRRIRSSTGASSRPMGVNRTDRVLRSTSRTPSDVSRLPDLYGERGLRDVHGLRRPRKAAVPRDGHESLQVPQVDVHRATLTPVASVDPRSHTECGRIVGTA